MNLKMWQWFARQSRTNQLIFVVAFAAFSSSAFLVKDGKNKDATITEKEKTIGDLTKANIECEQRNARSEEREKDKAQEELIKAREDLRKSDSMKIVLMTARQAVSKAIRNENKQ